MPARAVLALLLLLPAAVSAQDLDRAVSALVRISGERGGTPVRGSGFVVGLDRGKATIVTASHVIEGVERLSVTFAADLSEHFPAGDVLGMEAGHSRGLAVFQVRGEIPSGVTALSFETEVRPALGATLFLLGFPQRSATPRTAQRVLSAPSGPLLLIDQGVGEGHSGGPVLQNGKVVGVVTDTDEQTTYAVNAVVAREALVGWGVRLGGSTPPAASAPRTTPAAQATRPAAPAPSKPCVPGEERTETGMVFVRLCPGTFTMGATANDPEAQDREKPAHEVTLNELWIGKTEVTNEQYRRFRARHQGEAQLPAIDIGWDEAKAACEHFGGRLPTEAEWEYAARAGSRTVWSFGNEETKLGAYAWYQENAGSRLQPAGTRKPNAWGLHDLHGNAWEWVDGWHGPYPGAKRQPWDKSDTRVVRGGSFANPPAFLRSSMRGAVQPASLRSGFRAKFQIGIAPHLIGFRCAHPVRFVLDLPGRDE